MRHMAILCLQAYLVYNFVASQEPNIIGWKLELCFKLGQLGQKEYEKVIYHTL